MTGRDARNLHQVLQADALRLGQYFQSDSGEGSVLFIERNHIRHRSHRYEIEVVAQFDLECSWVFQPTTNFKDTVSEFENEADRTELAVVLIVAVRDVRIDQSNSRRQIFLGLVMVYDDDFAVRVQDALHRLYGVGAAIEGDEQVRLVRLAERAFDGFLRQTVSFFEPQGHDVGREVFELLQNGNHERGARNAVHIVVAADSDLLAIVDRLGDTDRRLLEIRYIEGAIDRP